MNGALFFQATDNINGTELWKSDGTDTGTVMVKDIYSGLYGSWPRYLINVNGRLFFAAGDGSNGYELWTSDGTPTGTVLAGDIYPGPGNSLSLTSVPMAAADGVLYFAANDGWHGVELYALKTSQPSKIGVFTNGTWYLDANKSWAWDGTPADILGTFGLGQPGAIPVVGDWSGDGTTKIGVYVNGEWYLDMNNNGQWDGEPTDVHGVFGIGLSNAIPVVGDWNGDGIAEIGIYSDGNWYLDKNRSWAWDGEPADTFGVFGIGLANPVPVTGDWNGDGITEIGIYSNGNWYLDKNRSWAWDGEPTDTFGRFGIGLANPIPVTGDWDGNGITKIGIYSEGNWYLDTNASWQWDGTPTDTFGVFGLGLGTVVPVTGNW
jgi:ELWxxDGT repeat protein